MSGPKVHLGTHYPVRSSEDVDKILGAPVNDEGTSPWLWVRLANGDLIFGCFPRGDTYMGCEVAFTEDWQAAERDGTVSAITTPVSDVEVDDDDPLNPVFAPGPGDKQWIGYPRANVPVIGEHFADQDAEQQLDWLLEAVTTASSDVNQRRYDLEAIAEIVTKHPQAGYGRMPIDTDVHGPECIICEGKEDFSFNPPGLSRDGHPYTEKVTPGQTVYVVDQDGATFVFLHEPHARRAAAQEAARGAVGLHEFTITAPQDVVLWQEDRHNDVLEVLADYACTHGPDFEIVPEHQRLVDLAFGLLYDGGGDITGNAEYMRGQIELLLDAGAVRHTGDDIDGDTAKDWLERYFLNRAKENA